MLKPWHDILDPALCRIQSKKLSNVILTAVEGSLGLSDFSLSP
jgi:hypothetical protein